MSLVHFSREPISIKIDDTQYKSEEYVNSKSRIIGTIYENILLILFLKNTRRLAFCQRKNQFIPFKMVVIELFIKIT